MFHLFKKVYLDFDDRINMSYDRIICSLPYGGTGDSVDLSKVFYGMRLASVRYIDELFGEKGKPFKDFLEMLELMNSKVDEHNSPVYVYCDKESYFRFAILWMKILLPYLDKENGWKFMKSHLFKEKNMVNSRLSSSERFARNLEGWVVLEAEFSVYWDAIEVTDEDRKYYKPFLDKVHDSLRIEFQLCSYLYDKRYGDHFAKGLTPLVKKDLEKFLYELKEVIIVHFQRPLFQELLRVENGPYDFDNFYDMPQDPSPYIQMLFNPKIWGDTRTTLYSASSGGKINFREITPNDVRLLREYATITGRVWSDSKWITSLRSESDKFDFIHMYRNKDQLSVEDADKILEYETHHQYHSAGAFYAIDLRSVNTYFVDFILQNYTDKDKLKPYVIELIE